MTTKTDEQLRAEFEAWAKGGFHLQRGLNGDYRATITQIAWACWQEAYQAGRAALQSQVKNDTTLFCDLKTDEEKSTFFLTGRGYETGVIAQVIQNDVAMAYHRCSEYRKELEALQSQDAEDAARLDWLQQGDGRFFKLLHITSIVGRGFSPTNSRDKWFSSLREAIDHARRIEGEGE